MYSILSLSYINLYLILSYSYYYVKYYLFFLCLFLSYSKNIYNFPCIYSFYFDLMRAFLTSFIL
nr:MAG TPA: hypothetical protein [Ackermannviridae sp.]